MKRSHLKPLIATMALTVLLGASFAAMAAQNCTFAYRFCMPRYYTCMASGVPQESCHRELDACLLRNGCSTLP